MDTAVKSKFPKNLNLTFYEDDFAVPAEWNFFATSARES
jgi:hypothetical protein